MLKLTKEDKMIILSIILIVCMIIVFLAAEMTQSIFSTSNENIDSENTLDELYNTLLSLPKNTESPIIRECLDNIFELINTREYVKLYSHLTDDAKKHLFPTEETFINYMTKQFGEKTYSPRFSKYKKFDNDVYIINVAFFPEQITNETLLENNVAEKNDVFTLFLKDPNNYKFSFKSHIASSSPNTKKGNEEITVTLKNINLYNSQTIFNINIKNNTNNDIFISNKKIFCQLGMRPVYYPSIVSIPANSDTNIDFTIYAGTSLKSSLPTTIAFSEIIVGNTVYMLNLPIKYPIELN